MRPVIATVETTVPTSLHQAWARFVPIDLTAIFKGFGQLPAVASVYDQTGPWDRVGESRKVDLADGSTLTETITDITLPSGGEARFGYVIRGFSGLIGRLVKEARGAWVFHKAQDGTRVRWDYTFEATNGWTRPVLAGVIRPLWRRYMVDALSRTGTILSAKEAV